MKKQTVKSVTYIIGPPASGKSELARKVHNSFSHAIFNASSKHWTFTPNEHTESLLIEDCPSLKDSLKELVHGVPFIFKVKANKACRVPFKYITVVSNSITESEILKEFHGITCKVDIRIIQMTKL